MSNLWVLRTLPLVALFAVAASAAAWAHHSAAVYYELDKQTAIEGVVTRFNLANPHARIYLTVKSAEGEEQQWIAEGGSRTVLLRKGWTGDELKPGDKIKIVGNPSRDGSKVVHWQALMLASGKRLRSEVPNPPQPEAQRRNGAPE